MQLKIKTSRDFEREKEEPLFDKPKGGPGRFVVRHGRIVPKHQVNNVHDIDDKRSDLPSPYIAPRFPEHRNMATGEMVDDRRKHREILRRYNLTEVGNEKPSNRPDTGPKKGEIAEDIKEMYDKFEAGYVNPEEGFYGGRDPKEFEHTFEQSTDDVTFDSPDVDLSSTDPQYVRANGSAPDSD